MYKSTIPTQYQKYPLHNPIFRIVMTNNSKTVTKLKLQNVKIQTISITIKLLGFLPKKGQDFGPKNIVTQYGHVWYGCRCGQMAGNANSENMPKF